LKYVRGQDSKSFTIAERGATWAELDYNRLPVRSGWSCNEQIIAEQNKRLSMLNRSRTARVRKCGVYRNNKKLYLIYLKIVTHESR